MFEVFPEAIHDDGTEVLACTLPPRHDPDLHPAVDEARGLRHAYDRAVATLRRTGRRRASGRRRRRPGRASRRWSASSTGTPWKEAGIPGIPARVAQDIRGYYETAALGLADHVPRRGRGPAGSSTSTEAGAIVLQARAAMRDADVKQPIWFYMAPGDR